MPKISVNGGASNATGEDDNSPVAEVETGPPAPDPVKAVPKPKTARR